MKKILNLLILYSYLLTLHLLKLYSHTVVLDICSCSDISVHFYTVWLFRVWEHIASTLTATVVGRKAHIVNSKCFCGSAALHSWAEGCATWAFSLDQKWVAMLSFPKALLSANTQGWVCWNSFGLPLLKDWHGLQSAGLCSCSGRYFVFWIHSCFSSRRIFVLLCSLLLWHHLDQASPLILAGSQKYSCSYLVLLRFQWHCRGPVSVLRPLGGGLCDLVVSSVQQGSALSGQDFQGGRLRSDQSHAVMFSELGIA